MSWEDKFRKWAGGPGDTEQQRCDNAESMIRKAVAADVDLKLLGIDVFAQGSFKNVTNIPQESDVDVSVCFTDTMYYELPASAAPADFGITPSSGFIYSAYKKSVAKAMKSHFGADNVTVGNKAIRIHSNTYRVDADVVPNVLFREYFDANDWTNKRDGVRFQADDGKWITNYPKQHTAQGIQKNKNTSKRFKRLARILKSLQVEMIDEGIISERLASFLLESLVYNVPDEKFGNFSYQADVRSVLAYVFNNTRKSDDASEWMEVNDVKYLFRISQPWTKAQANDFVSEAWDYVGFE